MTKKLFLIFDKNKLGHTISSVNSFFLIDLFIYFWKAIELCESLQVIYKVAQENKWNHHRKENNYLKKTKTKK